MTEKVWNELKSIGNQYHQLDNVMKNLTVSINDLVSQIRSCSQNINQHFSATNKQSQINDCSLNTTIGDGKNKSKSQRKGNYSRARLKVPSKKIDFNDPKNKGKCKWHILYGQNAYHCTLPCIESDKPLKLKPNVTNKPASPLNLNVSP